MKLLINNTSDYDSKNPNVKYTITKYNIPLTVGNTSYKKVKKIGYLKVHYWVL